MKDNSPPPPLAGAPGTPEELRAVLRALGREGPGRGTLERVARDLGPYMDAAPGLPVPVAVAARSGAKLFAARAFAGLLALGGTAYLAQRVWPREVERVARPSEVFAQPAPRVEVMAPEVEPDLQAPPVQDLLPAPAEHAAREHHHHHHHHHRHGRASATRADSGSVSTASTDSQSVASRPAEVAPVARAEPALSKPRAEEPIEEEQPARKLAEPPPDEVALLWKARERLRRDPAAALALLDAHADRFLNGQLAPEREVLAVEALRLLGRKLEAEARVRTFREHYPGSIHLRRLQSGR
jgi:hypothetical protein